MEERGGESFSGLLRQKPNSERPQETLSSQVESHRTERPHKMEERERHLEGRCVRARFYTSVSYIKEKKRKEKEPRPESLRPRVWFLLVVA